MDIFYQIVMMKSIRFNKQQVDSIIKENRKVQLNERTSSIVYHWCSLSTALKIVSSDRFSLMSTLFKKVESSLVGTSHNNLYYMSLTRNGKLGMGGYHNVHGLQVRITLDGDMLNSNFHIKALDYWSHGNSDMGKHGRVSGRTRIAYKDGRKIISKPEGETEDEDRLYARKPFINNAMSYIKSIDIYYDYADEKKQNNNLNLIYQIFRNGNGKVTLYKTIEDFNRNKNGIGFSEFYDVTKNISYKSTVNVFKDNDDIPVSFLASCAYLVNFPFGTMSDCLRTLREYGLEKYIKSVAQEYKKKYYTYIFNPIGKYTTEEHILRIFHGGADFGIFYNIQLANQAQSLDRDDLAKGFKIVTDFCNKHKLKNYKQIEEYFINIFKSTKYGNQIELKPSEHVIELTCVYVETEPRYQFISIKPEVDKYKDVFQNGDTNIRYLIDDIEHNVDSIKHKSKDSERFLSYIRRLLTNPTVKEVYDLCNKLQELGYENIDNDYYKPVFTSHNFNYTEVQWDILKSDYGFSKDGVIVKLVDKSQEEKIKEKWNNS